MNTNYSKVLRRRDIGMTCPGPTDYNSMKTVTIKRMKRVRGVGTQGRKTAVVGTTVIRKRLLSTK